MQNLVFRKLKLRGFTLIELMVVIGIIILLSTGGMAAYNQFNNRQRVRNEGAALTDLLRHAQSLTLSGEKPQTGVCTTAALDGYQVRVAGNQLIMEAVCGGEEVDVNKAHTLAGSDVSVASGTQVLFKVLAQGTTGEKFCLQGYDLTYRVRILTSGEVVEDGFVDSCDAPFGPLPSSTPLP